MRKFTFIAEYKGGTYISQYVASELYIALRLWATELDEKIFTKSERDRIGFEINDADYYPVALNGLDNVWCTAYLSNKSFLLLNIVETKSSTIE